MKVLGIDTSTKATSLAVVDEEGLRAEFFAEHEHPPSDASFAFLEKMLSEAELSLDQIDAFAVCIGPGSFTGLRIGLGMAKTFAWAKDRPIFGLDSVKIAATRVFALTDASSPLTEDVIVIVEGQRTTLFSARFAAGAGSPTRIGELHYDESPEALLARYPTDLALAVAAGETSRWENRTIVTYEAHPSPAELAARSGLARLVAGKRGRLEEVQPLYLKPFSVGRRAKRPEDLR